MSRSAGGVVDSSIHGCIVVLLKNGLILLLDKGVDLEASLAGSTSLNSLQTML